MARLYATRTQKFWTSVYQRWDGASKRNYGILLITDPKDKLKKSQKRKFLVSPEISRSVPSEAKALPPGKPNEVSKDETATRDATNALEDTSRCLFREKDALAETVEKHGQEIHNIHNTLWNVHAQIANLRLDIVRSETLSRILLENAGIPEQLITQRLAAANSVAQAQIESQRLQSMRLPLTGAATTENVSNGKNGDEGEGSCKMEEDTAQDEPTSDFSMAPRPAATMRVQGLAMASPQSHLVSELALSDQGFSGLVGTLGSAHRLHLCGRN